MKKNQNYFIAQSTIQIENNNEIVTRWDFPPKSHTTWHRHSFDFIVIPITNGTLRIENLQSEPDTFRNLVAGQSYNGKAGLEHNVINDSDDFISFVEVEIK